MSESDKRVFQQYIEELSGNIGKNMTNIQLIAKELQSVTDRLAELEMKTEETASQLDATKGYQNKTLDELEVQIRKLSDDCFS